MLRGKGLRCLSRLRRFGNRGRLGGGDGGRLGRRLGSGRHRRLRRPGGYLDFALKMIGVGAVGGQHLQAAVEIGFQLLHVLAGPDVVHRAVDGDIVAVPQAVGVEGGHTAAAIDLRQIGAALKRACAEPAEGCREGYLRQSLAALKGACADLLQGIAEIHRRQVFVIRERPRAHAGHAAGEYDGMNLIRAARPWRAAFKVLHGAAAGNGQGAAVQRPRKSVAAALHGWVRFRGKAPGGKERQQHTGRQNVQNKSLLHMYVLPFCSFDFIIPNPS